MRLMPERAAVRSGRHLPAVFCAMLLAAMALTALAVGAYPLSPLQLAAVVGHALGLPVALPGAPAATVVWDLRLPRVILAGTVGAALALAGASMQALFRNPLADPGLIGVSGGAAVAAALLMVAGVTAPFALPSAAFCGGVLATALIYRLSRYRGRTLPATLLLAGVAVNAMAGAVLGMLAYLASAPALRGLTFWLLGSFAQAGWGRLAVALPVMAVASGLMLREAGGLNALLLGEREAAHLGVPVQRLTARLMLWVALAVGAAVAVTGIIGFVGLMVPHWVRMLTGPDHRRLLPATALAGAALMIAADTLARTVAAPAELPVGVLTALLGGPFFLWLLLRYRGRALW